MVNIKKKIYNFLKINYFLKKKKKKKKIFIKKKKKKKKRNYNVIYSYKFIKYLNNTFFF